MSIYLKPVVTQAGDCKSFTFSETTGTYNSSTNTGGYGAPNFTVADVNTATVTITPFESDTSTEINVFSTFPTTDSEIEFTITNEDMGYSEDESIADGVYDIVYELTGDFAITGVNTGTKTFTVAGNRSGVYAAGDTFTITGSTGNNGTYTVVSSTYTSSTAIVVSETVPSAVVDGNINFTAEGHIYSLFFCGVQCCLNEKLLEVETSDCDCLSGKVALISKIDIILKAAKYAALCGKPNKAQSLMLYLVDLCDLSSCSSCG